MHYSVLHKGNLSILYYYILTTSIYVVYPSSDAHDPYFILLSLLPSCLDDFTERL
jgi:hypothetical protein